MYYDNFDWNLFVRLVISGNMSTFGGKGANDKIPLFIHLYDTENTEWTSCSKYWIHQNVQNVQNLGNSDQANYNLSRIFMIQFTASRHFYWNEIQ